MSAFTLDTSGVVLTGNLCSHPTGGIGFEWSDLTPFAQGYVEALLRDAPSVGPLGDLRFAGFSDLSPEALAMILGDCEAGQAIFERQDGPINQDVLVDAGRMFWRERSKGNFGSTFPPLTPYLGDDGRIYLRLTEGVA